LKHHHSLKGKRLLALLLGAVLLLGNFGLPARAAGEEDPLKPDDLLYEDGNIILHKQAERVGPDEWDIHVKATIKDQPVEPPKLEVTFVLDASNTMNMCAEEYLHNTYFSHYYHGYGGDCTLICTNTDAAHIHEDACYSCGTYRQQHSSTGNQPCKYYIGEGFANENAYESRFSIAKQVISKMVSALPDGTNVSRIMFNDSGAEKIVTSFDAITPIGDTYMMNGVRLALNSDCFTDDPSTKKIMIIVTDGAASDDDYGATDSAFQAFRSNGGIVYTIGFNHNDPNLLSMVANGGTYSQASNPAELEQVFDHITYELTAMLVDPMGQKVGFEINSAQQPTTSVEGSITYDPTNSTLYWNPSSSSDIANSSIEYTYTVKLNQSADWSVGVHSGVDLNLPTDLLYGVKSSNEMKSAAFPIPAATYAVSSLQVQWQCGGTNLKTPSAVESVICDYPGAAFATDYTAAEPSITIGDKTYYYTGTVITKNGAETDAVTIEDAAAFVVTHQYTEEVRYKVTYSYEGTVPAGAPDPSAYNVIGLKSGETVTLAADPVLEGYAFSGWEAVTGSISGTGTIQISDFDVTLVGRWAKLNGYRVTANYYTVTDGGSPVQDNESPVLVAEDLKTAESSVNVDLSGFFTYDGNTYDSVTAEGAAQIDGRQLSLVPSDPAAEITLTFLREIRNPYTVTVRYVDDAGETLLPDDVSAPILSGDDYDVTAKALPTVRTEDGRVLDFVNDNDVAYEGTVTDHDIEIVRTYVERGTAMITVLYVNEAGDELMTSSNSGDVYVGEPYDVSDAERFTTIVAEDGKIFDFVGDGDAAYTGTMGENGAEIIRVYKERQKATVTVRFEDEAGNALRDPMSKTVYRNTAYDVLDAWYIDTITKDGKIYDVKPGSYDLYSGTLTEDKTIVRVYRERAKATLSVTFLDTDNYFLRDAIFEDVYYYAEYDVREVEEIVSITTADGRIFDFIDDSDAVYTGTMPPQGYGIIRVYKERAKATATVHYVDETGKQLQADLVSDEIYVGTEYDVSAAEEVTTITVDGVIYDFASNDSDAYTGTMDKDGVTITRTYKERAKATATVQYVDENGNKLQADLVSDEIYVGTEYDVSAAEEVATITVDGVIYDFASNDSDAYTGTMDEDGVTITRTYKERAKATATVHYVDENGNKLQADLVSDEIYVGTEYDVSAAEEITTITVDGVIYDFDSDGDAAYTGTMIRNGIEIERVYKERAKAPAVVTFINEEGVPLCDAMEDLVYVDTAYDVSAAEEITTITTEDGTIYDFDSDGDAAYTGTMIRDGIKIERVYKERAKAPAVVTFINEEGVPLRDAMEDLVYVDTAYDISDAEEITTITTEDGTIYDFNSDGDAAYNGTMTGNGIKIERVYKERAKAPAVVTFINEEGVPLCDATEDLVYVDTAYDVSAAEEITTITVDGVIYDFDSDGDAAYNGTMTGNGIKIERIYKERAKATVTVHYVDNDGNPLQDDLISDPIYVGSSYDVSDVKEVITITADNVTYDFLHDGEASYTGTMPEGGLEITRVYLERGKAFVTVHFVDEDGKQLRESMTSDSIYVGAEYDISAAADILSITADGVIYDFTSDANASYTGTMPEGGLVITRVYTERAKATVTVRYVDKDGNKLLADTVETGYIGTSYDVTSAKFSSISSGGKTYEYVSDGNAVYSGTIPETGVEITRVYALKAAPVTPNTGDRGFGLWTVLLMMSASMLPMLTFGKRRLRRS